MSGKAGRADDPVASAFNVIACRVLDAENGAMVYRRDQQTG